MSDQMPKEEQEKIDKIKQYMLKATNMKDDEAYRFARICCQMGFEKIRKEQKTARQIFSELGYELSIKNNEKIVYEIDKSKISITFYLEYEEVINTDDVSINVDELKAINKQVEELGWL